MDRDAEDSAIISSSTLGCGDTVDEPGLYTIENCHSQHMRGSHALRLCLWNGNVMRWITHWRSFELVDSIAWNLEAARTNKSVFIKWTTKSIYIQSYLHTMDSINDCINELQLVTTTKEKKGLLIVSRLPPKDGCHQANMPWDNDLDSHQMKDL